jgi:hypothetical protein
MDENKLKVLQDIEYSIPAHCGLCDHADLSSDGWGTCRQHKYSHLKHSKEESPLSIHRSGHCNWFKLDEQKLAAVGLHGFKEFVGLRTD